MSSLTVRNLDEGVKAGLRIQAAEHGWSMEQEVRHILQQAISDRAASSNLGFARRIRQRFEGLEIEPLPIPERRTSRTPPEF